MGGDFYDVFNTGSALGGRDRRRLRKRTRGGGADRIRAAHATRGPMQEEAPSRILGLLSEAIMAPSAPTRSSAPPSTAGWSSVRRSPDDGSIGGHPLPLLLTGEGRSSSGRFRNAARLGSRDRLADQVLDLRPGSPLVLYTDGVTEAGKPRGAFGIGGLRSLLGSCAGLAAHEIAERIDNAVVGLGSPADDIAVLVLRIRE